MFDLSVFTIFNLTTYTRMTRDECQFKFETFMSSDSTGIWVENWVWKLEFGFKTDLGLKSDIRFKNKIWVKKLDSGFECFKSGFGSGDWKFGLKTSKPKTSGDLECLE